MHTQILLVKCDLVQKSNSNRIHRPIRIVHYIHLLWMQKKLIGRPCYQSFCDNVIIFSIQMKAKSYFNLTNFPSLNERSKNCMNPHITMITSLNISNEPSDLWLQEKFREIGSYIDVADKFSLNKMKIMKLLDVYMVQVSENRIDERSRLTSI